MEDIKFMGECFRFYGKYYCRTGGGKGERYLHRAIWSHHNGTIPSGYHIHHIDGVSINNSINNLHLIYGPDHNREHGLTAVHLKSQERKDLLDRIRPLSHLWHKTEQARKVMSEVAKRKPLVDATCMRCQSVFQCRNKSVVKYCSTKCKKRAYRFNASVKAIS